jgi:hypothetical protein
MLRRINPQTIDNFKTPFVVTWPLIAKSTTDRLCQDFEVLLELCLADDANSTANQFWRISKRTAMTGFFEENRAHVSWAEAEDDRRLYD